MAQPIPLSDGSFTVVPDNATPEQIAAQKDAGENALAPYYMKKAADQNAPYTPNKIGTNDPGEVTYSGVARYPNTANGQVLAWGDHHGTGALSAVADPMSGGIGGAVERAGTSGASMAISPWLDPVLQGLSLAKQRLGGVGLFGQAIPKENQDIEPIPTVGQVLGQDIGAPQLSSTATPAQRILEGTAGLATGRAMTRALPGPGSVAASILPGAEAAAARAAAQNAPTAVRGWGETLGSAGAQAARDLGWTTAGTVASDIASRKMGDIGGYIASLLFSGAVPVRAGASAFIGPRIAHPDAPDIRAAGIGYGAPPAPETPNRPQQNVTPGITPGTFDFSPSFRALAGPRAQRFSNWLESMPWAGGPLARSNEATAQFVQNQRGTAAEQLAGGPMPPGGATPESIGSQLIQGAREAVPVQQARRSALYDPINAAMTGQDVDFAPVQSAVNTMTARNQMPVSQANAIQALVNEVTSMAPGGANYDPARGPVPPLPQRTMMVPWTAAKEWLSGISRLLGVGPLASSDARVAALKQTGVQAMQQGAEAQSPGLGQQYRQAQQGYADIGRNVLDPLYRLSGQPGAPGQFGNVGEGSAYNWLRGNLQSPSNIEPIATHLPPDYWNQARGQMISTLGNTPGGGFRPDIFARDWGRIGPQVQQQLTQGPGGMTDAYRRLQSASTIGRNFNVPPSASGLVSAIGTGAAAKTALDVGGQVAASALPRDTWYHGLISRAVGPAAGALGVTRAMESPEMKAAMAGRSVVPFVAQKVFNAMPRIAALQEEEPGRWPLGWRMRP